MTLSTAQKTYYGGGFIAGIVIAALFGFLAAESETNQAAYIGAAIVAGVAGLVCGIILLAKKG